MTENRAQHAPLVHIEATHGAWASLKLRELWKYHGLMYFMVWRDIKVKYKQTVLGGLWAVVQPLFTMAVFTVIFGQVAHISSEGLPYPLFSFAALVPFGYFQNGMLQASESLVSNSNLIRKVYFPRLIAPISAVLGGLLDFVMAFVMLLILMGIYGRAPGVEVLAVPLYLLLATISALGIGLWFAGLNAKFRDVRYTMGFLMQVMLFLTPVAYSANLIHQPWRTVYALNPMVSVVEGFRWALLHTTGLTPAMVAISTVTAVTLLVTGAFFFRRLERTFADVV